jgi:putative ATP-dependent endonuclease of OLD family
MYISKVEIYNFRSHKKTITELLKTNVLIGQNNTGKTAFLDAVNYAIGMRKGTPSEDDFYAGEDKFDPQNSDPIRIILEFRETNDNRFSENVLYIFDKAIQFDEEQCPEDPVKYIRMCYEVKYDKERDRYVDDKYFVDINNKKLPKDSVVRGLHSSFFPFFYLTTLRDINREIKNKSSFWGKLKASIDYKDKEKDIKKLIEQINNLVLKDNTTADDLISKLKELEKNVNISSDSLYLQAFSKRSWELLDELNI